MKNKKIIIFANSLWNIKNFRIHLINKLINLNYNLYIIAPKSDDLDFIKNLECKFIPLNIHRKSINPLKEFIVLIKLFFIFKRIQPNIIISFTIKPNIYSSIISRILSIKNIVTFTGLGSSLIRNNLFKKFIFFILYNSLKNTNFIFFQNKTDKEYMISKINYIKKNSEIVPGSGIDLKKFRYDLDFKNRISDNVNILMISRILKDKGVYEYFNVSKKILANYSNVNFSFLGPFDQKNPSMITEKEFNKLLKQSNINYLGYDKNIIKHIVRSDVVVLPSYREGLPRSILEALAIGRPVIVSNVPGCIDLVDNEKNGYIFKITDINDFYLKLEKIINLSQQKRYKMGLIGRKLVENKYTEDIVTNIYIEHIKKL